MQDEFDKPKIEEKGIPGPRFVAWMFGFMLLFPVLCMAALLYARRVGQSEGTVFGYSAMRDPKAWLFILFVLVASAIFAKWMGRNAKNRSNT